MFQFNPKLKQLILDLNPVLIISSNVFKGLESIEKFSLQDVNCYSGKSETRDELSKMMSEIEKKCWVEHIDMYLEQVAKEKQIKQNNCSQKAGDQYPKTHRTVHFWYLAFCSIFMLIFTTTFISINHYCKLYNKPELSEIINDDETYKEIAFIAYPASTVTSKLEENVDAKKQNDYKEGLNQNVSLNDIYSPKLDIDDDENSSNYGEVYRPAE